MNKFGLWYDFSVGFGGGPIELIQRLQGGNCYEAGRTIVERGWATCSLDLAAPVVSQKSAVMQGVRRAVAEPDGPQNAPIRQDLLTMCDYHPYLEERGISEETCDLLGIGFLPQGRSPLRGRIVFQVADARVTKKSDGERTRVILSHLGRALQEDVEPKYLFYQGFHKSAELYGQELIWLHEDAAEQIREAGAILLTEGPIDVAKAVEAGFRNVVGSFGATLSDCQAIVLKEMAEEFGVNQIRIAYDRDDAGRAGATKAAEKLRQKGLEPRVFKWDAPIGRSRTGDVFVPEATRDLADFTTEQLTWLRARAKI